ncbi:hypothetical protein [Stutzerimonas kunmingensis]|nr:hypothetical protein [Stutzerimonas kunmingensis]
MNDYSTAGIDRIDLLRTFIRIVDAGSLRRRRRNWAPPNPRSAAG